MADHGSDSSDGGDVETNVLLGYASKEPTGDDFSQLGGHPGEAWLDGDTTPSGSLARCKVCNQLMSLLLQLHADNLEKFPGHERRLYVWVCRRKPCRRKEGSIRAFRGVRITRNSASVSSVVDTPVKPVASPACPPPVNLGDALFGVTSPSIVRPNPFSGSTVSTAAANPFATPSSPSPAPNPSAMEKESSLVETFAQKARISTAQPAAATKALPLESWPATSSFPAPYPTYHVDAEKEYLDAELNEIPANTRLDSGTMDAEGSNSATDIKDAFESSMDKTFQRFADRLSQNPEQILRYDFDGSPLLYSKNDVVGERLAQAHDKVSNVKVQIAASREGVSNGSKSIAGCTSCGSPRLFELQLTPHAIAELEVDEMGIDGMDWGTIIVCVCAADCNGIGEKKDEQVVYVEEWAGVQWEELADKRR